MIFFLSCVDEKNRSNGTEIEIFRLTFYPQILIQPFNDLYSANSPWYYHPVPVKIKKLNLPSSIKSQHFDHMRVSISSHDYQKMIMSGKKVRHIQHSRFLASPTLSAAIFSAANSCWIPWLWFVITGWKMNLREKKKYENDKLNNKETWMFRSSAKTESGMSETLSIERKICEIIWPESWVEFFLFWSFLL